MQLNFLHAWLFLKSICPDSDGAHLNDPIHIPDFVTRQRLSFPQMEEPHISMFPAATNVSDWPFYLCATNFLLGYKLEQSDTGRSLCSVKDKRIIFQSSFHTKIIFNFLYIFIKICSEKVCYIKVIIIYKKNRNNGKIAVSN